MNSTNEYKKVIRRIPVKDIGSDMRYQRQVSARVKRIASEYDENKLGVIVVSQREDGTYWVIDGQHRVQATLQKKGENATLLALVYYGMTPKDEAVMFATQHDNVKAPTKGEFFKAQMFAGNEDVIRFKDATEAEGLECDFSDGHKRDGALICYAAAFNIFMSRGEVRYRKVLSVLVDAWGGDGDSVTANFVKGMDIFLNVYENDVSTKKLVDSLKKVSPAQIERESKMIQEGGAKRYARQFLRVYNKRRGTRKLEDKIV